MVKKVKFNLMSILKQYSYLFTPMTINYTYKKNTNYT